MKRKRQFLEKTPAFVLLGLQRGIKEIVLYSFVCLRLKNPIQILLYHSI